MQHTIIIHSLDAIDAAAREFISRISNHKLIAFYASMGTGKTTFTRAICSALGVDRDAVSSPTFAIINEYRNCFSEPIYHFDFYRITKENEALDLGLYDYLDSGALCLIEWPENIEHLLPDETLKVRISVREDQARVVEWED